MSTLATSSLVPPTRPYFGKEAQAQLAAEDSEAWRSVITILLTIVTGGLLACVLTVLTVLAVL
ncbi:hypothetical protein [Lignipirellula cremea]|uniref:Uncharacterized protein n=1 Tax=Lignipirellula cremea TaxID=2528010 RepID=A0A518DL85_9BACT|nr:hypothetical protein [Lignipirellula cremea]QDU92599.1 hypothetical protein Pla8534_03470 [Lignipirellula cremea]